MNAVTCPRCEGRGEIPKRGTTNRDPYTGTWDADWVDCTSCDGTGAVSDARAAQVDGHLFWISRLPAVDRIQYRCPRCWCHVDPPAHVPGSEGCAAAAQERHDSITAED